MKKIFILAQNPKNENNITSPLVNTKSEERLQHWLDECLDPNEAYVIQRANSTNFLDNINYTTEDEVRIAKAIFDLDADKVIALGNVASSLLTKIRVDHFKAQHPSGLNRNLNDPELVAEMLEDMREYLNDDEDV
jgi:hypothetical protein